MSVSVAVPVSPFDVSDKLLHHQEGHDAAQDPEADGHRVLVLGAWRGGRRGRGGTGEAAWEGTPPPSQGSGRRDPGAVRRVSPALQEEQLGHAVRLLCREEEEEDGEGGGASL